MSETHKCPTCSGPVRIGGKGDGTLWYEPVPAVARLVEWASNALEIQRMELGDCSIVREGDAALAPFRDAAIRKEAGK